jgi:vacuolar-type H+-ATPase subunit E/Vma4
MAEELKALIDKIKEEGVLAAEESGRVIEDRARRTAEEVTAKAREKADALIAEARERITRMEAGSRAELKQASRDMILGLRKEISAMLDKIITSHVGKALDAEEMAKIIAALVKEQGAEKREGIVVTLKKEDLEKLERQYLSELRTELKKGVTLRSSDEIQGGFLISYDSGKSYYDFTDKALARHLAFQMKPKLAEILNEGTS